MQTRVLAVCSLVVALLQASAIFALSKNATCPVLDSSGCCGLACQRATCRALHFLGATLGATTIASPTWRNSGWNEIIQAPGASGDAACQQYMATAAGTAHSSPGYCSWYGITCNATAHSSTCNQPGATYAVSEVQLIREDLSGNISTPGFMESLKQLHDCGLTSFVLGGSAYDVRGQLSPLLGQFDRLKTFAIFTTNITGTLPREMGKMTALEELYLQGNYLDGTIPEEFGDLQNLRVLNLAKNGFTDVGLAMHGPLPSSFERLRKLEVLSLEANAFSGTLPPSMCLNMTSLNAIGLRDNNFRGSAALFGQCGLISLDIANNYFSGSLPRPVLGSRAWENLTVIRLSNNMFSGTLPDMDFGEVRVLSHVSVANNSLTGAIPVSWTLAPWLSSFDVSSNSISGTIHRDFAFLARLTSLLVNNNANLTGTISPWFRLAVSLERLHLQNTDVNGSLPGITRSQWHSGVVSPERLCGSDAAGLGRIPNLQTVTILATEMAAACGENNELKSIDDALPWYLSVDENTWQAPLPEPDFSSNQGLECPRIIQTQYCNLNQPPQDFPADRQPVWVISPSYYHYLGCRCFSNYTASWSWRAIDGGNGCRVKQLTCTPRTGLAPEAIFGVSFAVGVVGVTLLAYCLYVSWYGRWGLPKLKRAYDDLKKRHDGAPKSGKVSFVVTDIEGYSALIVAMPLVMGRAISHHNNVMRKAAWTHYGFTIGQEGDSYLLAFREALDAVAFCLQVQQALMKVDWPQELLLHQQQQDALAAGLTLSAPNEQSNHSSLHGSSYSAQAQWQPRRSSSGAIQGLGASPSSNPGSAAEANAASAAVGMPLRHRDSRPIALLPSSSKDEQANSSHAAVVSAAANGGRSGSSSSGVKAADSCSSATIGSTLWQQGPVRCISTNTQVTGQKRGESVSVRAPAAGSDAFARLASVAAAAVLGPMAAAAAAADASRIEAVAAVSVMVPGLRVRMGVASGVLSDKEDCFSSKVLEVARVVSDAGAGGQVLICSSTFSQIKDRLEELGQVGTSGYSRSSRVTGWGTPRGCLARRLRRRIELSAEAFVLDMGLYSIPGFVGSHPADSAKLLADLPPAAATAASATQDGAAAAAAAVDAAQTAAAVEPARGGQQCHISHSSPSRLVEVVEGAPGVMRATAARETGKPPPATNLGTAAAAAAPAAVAVQQSGCLRLYQVLAPKLLERAHLYGNKLQLKSGTTLHDLPYFCAPAAANRSLLDQVLMQSPGLAGLWKHGTGNTTGRQLVCSTIPSSRLLSGLSDNQQQPVSPVTSSSGGIFRLWRQQQQQQQTPGTHAHRDDSNRGFGGLFHHRPGGSSAHQQQHWVQAEGAAMAAAAAGAAADSSGAGSDRAAAAELGLKDDQLSPSPAAGSGSSSVWLMPRLPLQQQQQQAKVDAGGVTTDGDGAITFVFCSVVLPNKAWITLEPSVTTQVSSIISRVLRQCLLALAEPTSAVAAVPGPAGTAPCSGGQAVKACGYICREVAADLKYLLVFHSPRLALEWCLLVQEVLLWQDWPSAVLEKSSKAADHQAGFSSAAAAKDVSTDGPAAAAVAVQLNPQQQQQQGGSDRPLFRGPRMKMGVACGAPQTVSPDHMGRADYHGNSINMAARYEVVCSQGGQVVCDAALAAAVVVEWTEIAANAADADASMEAAVELQASVADAAGEVALLQWQQEQRELTALLSPPRSGTPFAAAEAQQQQQQEGSVQPLISPTATGTSSLAFAIDELSFSSSPRVATTVSGTAAAAALAVAAAGGPGAAAHQSIQVCKNTAVQLPSNAPQPDACGLRTGGQSHAPSVPLGISNSAAAAAPCTDGFATANGFPTSQQQQQLVSKGSSSSGGFRWWKHPTGKEREALPSRRASSTAIELPTIDSGSAGAAAGCYEEAAAGLVYRTVSDEPTMPHGWGGGAAAATAAAAGRPSSPPGLVAASPRRSFPGYSPNSSIPLYVSPGIGPIAPGRRAAASVRQLIRGTAAAAPAVVHMEPTPTQLPCACCLSELPSESFAVEVHQIGKFIVKGQSAPVEMVEIVLSHLAGRRALLAEAPAKSAKGRLLEPQSAKCAVVPSVDFPAVALRYRQQYQQRTAAAAVAAAQLRRATGAENFLPSRSQTMASLRQKSLPVSLMATRALSSFSGGSSLSTAAAAAASGGSAVVAGGPGSWVRRAFSVSSTSGSDASNDSSPRPPVSQRHGQLGLSHSITESADEGQV